MVTTTKAIHGFIEIPMNYEWATWRETIHIVHKYLSKQRKCQKKCLNRLNVYLHSYTHINAYWLAHDKATGEQLPKMRMHAPVKRGQGNRTNRWAVQCIFYWLIKHEGPLENTEMSRLACQSRGHSLAKSKKKGHVTLTQYQHGHFRHQNRAMNREHCVYYPQALIIHSC